MSGDTIFALSSGSVPAAIAVMRISGPAAGAALQRVAGALPRARRAELRTLRDPDDGSVLDRALVLYMPGPTSATGEDCAELHLHGGRAVVSAVSRVLGAMEHLRAAEAGEFTRRAFANGRMDLAEAEGLADLLTAETELQRRNAQALAGGALSRKVDAWRDTVLHLAAEVEANLDFSDEEDAAELPRDFFDRCRMLPGDLQRWLGAPRAETLREGFRVVIAGPPNSGKSTLFNALIDDDAAIATPIAGTTRDVLLRPVAFSGVPFLFADTAGLRNDTDDEVERIGIARAQAELERADLVLWLGPEGEGPSGSWEIETMIDRPDRIHKRAARLRVSAESGQGIEALRTELIDKARSVLPAPGQVAVSRHQASLLQAAHDAIERAAVEVDGLLVAENLRVSRVAFDRLTGRASTEDMLDTLFGRFCIGK